MSDTAEDFENARKMMATIVADPANAPTSLLLSAFIGLIVGRGLGQSGRVDGTTIDRDPAIGVLGAELDRRIPLGRLMYSEEEQILDREYGDLKSTGTLSHRSALLVYERTIDTRPCDPFLPEDCDWGEQDSLENVPRKRTAAPTGGATE